ncbi:MAG: rhamnogalacturonan lyase [Prevotella sp.]|nr:rhamnogalacturonan lyase [Prevotella sp.]
MKKTILALIGFQLAVGSLMAQYTPVSQMEKLDRGVVALPRSTGTGIFLSWRLLGTDDPATTTFDVVRNGETIKENLAKTNFEDGGGTKTASYQIVTKVNGEVVETSEAVSPWGKTYLTLKLDRPAKGEQGGTYTPNDMSVGDVDGDGQYELFVKWDPSTSKDNSQSGVTDNVYIDCYKLDGTKLWRIDLGRNIRAGAHYTQFMVYDFDRDGRAELMCKTAPGSLDGNGNYVNLAATDDDIKNASGTGLFRTSDGRITGGQEWLTVFKGATGEAIHTIFYNPNRNMTYGGAADGKVNWGDVDGKNDAASYGNRGERFLAAVAYLDGPDQPASGIFSRGYYGHAFIWAVGFDGEHLYQKWLSQHKTSKTAYTLYTYDAEGNRTSKAFTKCQPTSGKGSGTMFGNGNHNMSIADLDGDGCDEIVWGSAALDHDGRLLYGTGFGHGDAIHLADHCPDRPGLEVFQIHEESPYGWDLHDAFTGEVLYSATGDKDNGRGIAAQLDSKMRGSFFSSSNDRSQRSAVTGEVVSTKSTSMNFRIYWDGDAQEELFDGGYNSNTGKSTPLITKWNGNGTTTLRTFDSSYGNPQSCNSTKATPSLQADLLGDWREELVMWDYNNPAQVHIYTTNITSALAIPTLMHDHTYRMGICWQNTAYNQPPHLGYYLPDYVAGTPNAIQTLKNGESSKEPVLYDLQGRRIQADRPFKGVAIERQGGKSRKMVID